jgi:hypothetical protein
MSAERERLHAIDAELRLVAVEQARLGTMLEQREAMCTQRLRGCQAARGTPLPAGVPTIDERW